MTLKAWTGCPGTNIHVHHEGCSDTKRQPYTRLDQPFTVVGSTRREVATDVYPPDQYDWDGPDDWKFYAEDIKLFPCTNITL